MKRKTKVVVLPFSVRPSELELSFLLLPHELIYVLKAFTQRKPEAWKLYIPVKSEKHHDVQHVFL